VRSSIVVCNAGAGIVVVVIVLVLVLVEDVDVDVDVDTDVEEELVLVRLVDVVVDFGGHDGPVLDAVAVRAPNFHTANQPETT
jgi:hypothetical protein